MSRLRIGFNALFMRPERIGMSTVFRSLAAELVRAADHELVVYCTADAAAMLRRDEPWSSEVRIVIGPAGPVAPAERAIRIASELAWIPARARRDRLDVVHHTANVAPFVRTVPSVMTIHDLMWRHFPGTHPGTSRLMLDVLTPLGLRSVDRVVTVSHFTADDVVAAYGVARVKVQVVPLGPGKAVAGGDAVAARARWNLGERPVVLSMGLGFETKNVHRLIQAFAEFGPARGAVLVHVGASVHEGERWKALVRELDLDAHVRFPGFEHVQLTDAELDDLYAAASVYVHPSVFEGFGLPVLEAMERGVPVACSRAASLPEVGGDAPVYFNPYDVGDIAAVVASLLDGPAIRSAAAARGLARAAQFTWRRTAQEYAAIYADVARKAAE